MSGDKSENAHKSRRFGLLSSTRGVAWVPDIRIPGSPWLPPACRALQSPFASTSCYFVLPASWPHSAPSLLAALAKWEHGGSLEHPIRSSGGAHNQQCLLTTQAQTALSPLVSTHACHPAVSVVHKGKPQPQALPAGGRPLSYSFFQPRLPRKLSIPEPKSQPEAAEGLGKGFSKPPPQRV